MADATYPGSYSTPTIAPVFVGGIPLSELTKALTENQRLLAAQKAHAAEQFWSSPRRQDTDKTREVYEVSLNSAKLVNALAFELAHFPHRSALFYKDLKTGAWTPLQTIHNWDIDIPVTNSVPAVLTPPPTGSTEHPQHYGAGHWVSRYYHLKPVKARQFRLVMVRIPSPLAPVDRARKKVAYSLGVRGFDIGYKVWERKDVPVTPRHPIIVTERDTFASTTDILGSPVSISVRENRASDLLKGSTWRSEPQPISNAVVSMYVDARDGRGQAQTIDRFYLEPTTTGASMNVYFSNDTPDQTTFPATDTPLDFPLTRPAGVGGVDASPTGLVFPGSFGYVDVDNAGVQLNQTRPFWIGMSVEPRFAADEALLHHPFLDTGTLLVEWHDEALWATLGDTTVTYSRNAQGSATDDTAVTTEPMFTEGEEFPFAVGYDGETLSLFVDGQVRTATVTPFKVVKAPVTASGMSAYLRIGGVQVGDDQNPGVGKFRLGAMIVKAETPPASLDDFFLDPADFVNNQSDNALLRQLPQYQTTGAGSINPLGFVGGPGNRYEDLVWAPINRDYRLAKGYVVFNPVKAKYFKFEFTNLVAQTYDDYSPKVRTVKVFPTALVYSRVSTSASNNTARGGATTSQSAASTLFFGDQARLYTNTRPAQPDATYTPTAGVYSTDPKIALSLRAKSMYHNLQAWHARVITPRFVDVQKHRYEQIEVSHTQRVAYFVGLSKIVMSRLDYTTGDDTEQYLEPFSDSINMIADEDGQPIGGWNLDDGWLATPDEMGVGQTVRTLSKVFASQRRVTGLQFATQQTPPVQLLPDPDLDDPTLANWRGFGDAQVTASDAFSTDIGTMAEVKRDSTANFWDVIESRYDSWDEMEELGLTWDDLEASGNINPEGGLSAATSHAVSPRGRLYAAARVYALADLSAPLYVQIVASNGRVLAEEAIDVKAGQIAEWYAAYTIGESGEEIGLTWDQMDAIGNWDAVEAKGTWDQVAETSLTHIGRVTARVVQVEPTADSWFVDNVSLFDDAIIWEFSNNGGRTWYPAYDIRNDPHGTFMFPDDGNDYDGLGLRWRVIGTREHQRIDYLAIRPWYDSLPLGQPYRETIQSGGPNQALIDHYPPITEDPRWQVWDKPIPEEWWFVFRQWLLEQRPTQEAPPFVIAPDAIPVD